MPPNVNADSEFTIAVINDTQHYVEQDNGIFEQMTQWVADNQETYNIQTFWHGGDIVEDYNDEPAEWDIALNAIETITDEGITPLLGTGNHDIGTNSTRDRNLSEFHNHFGTDWYSNLLDTDPTVNEWDTYEGDSENLYIVQEYAGVKFIWVVAEYVPRDGVMDWVESTFDAHSEKVGGYLTHYYLTNTGEFGTDTNYINAPANSGQSQWQNWIQNTENVGMAMGGHYHDTSDFNDRRTDTTTHGKQITAQHHNYQSADSNGGNGWLRLLVVDTDTGTVDAYTYSPYLDQWDTGSSTQYSFTYWSPEFETVSVRRYDGADWTAVSVEEETGNGLEPVTVRHAHDFS